MRYTINRCPHGDWFVEFLEDDNTWLDEAGLFDTYDDAVSAGERGVELMDW